MDFEKFLPSDEEDDELLVEDDIVEKIGIGQFYDIITGDKPDWQSIIYELIHTEQLDPWDIDIVFLTSKYFEKIHEMEEMDFYISSKVLLAASLLLRIKSDFLLSRSIKSIDEVLFGKKDDEKKFVEKIIIEEDDLPLLIPKTPLPRARRVTLPELMIALNKAINTESRRIKREVSLKRAKRISEINLPEFRKIDLKDRIKQFYARVLTSINQKAVKPDRDFNKIGYCDLVGSKREQKVACFLPLLHLSNNKKLWLEQENHLEEIWVYLHKYFEKNKDIFLKDLNEGLEEDDGEGIFENVEGENLSGLEKARLNKEKKKIMAEEIAKELAEELGEDISEINKQESIDEITGFEN